MKFKRFLIIFLCVALLAAFSVSCFATSQETYGFYISPGEYVLSEVLDVYAFNILFRFSFTSNDTVFYGLFFYDLSLRYVTNPATNSAYEVYNIDSELWSDEDYRYITVLDGFYIYNIDIYQWWVSNVTRVSPGYNSSFFDNMFSIFNAIGQWISGSVANLTTMFFVDNSLTFVGTLSIAALSMAVVFLIIGLISRFLRFKA